MFNRRTFLGQMGAAGLLSLGAPSPAFWARAAERAADNGRILVLVQLAGGNDGLNTIVPYANDEYYKARPGIAVPKGAVHKLDDELGLHPQMTGFKELFDEGMLSIVQGVGYANPNRSHFRSMDIWQSARPKEENISTGWIGRALDAQAGSHADTVPALALGTERLPLSMVGEKVHVPTIRSLASFQLQLGRGPENQKQLRRRAITELADRSSSPGSTLDFLRKTASTAYQTAARVRETAAKYEPAVDYPGSRLAQMLKLVAQLIAGEMGTRVFFVSLGGFDTHSQQQPAHQALLGELSSAVRAFSQDLAAHKLADRVLLATFSEFGRRVAENGSLGTDHGAAAQMFLMTATGKGGVHGEHPSLTDLEQGDLKFHTDFRSVYATLLTRWLNVPSAAVLDGEFPLVDAV